MTNKNNDSYRNQPQFKTNQSLNKDITPDVPTFNSNAMDNEGFMPLNSCSGGCGCKGHDEKAHKKKTLITNAAMTNIAMIINMKDVIVVINN
ncbi:MAG: hypothetical protein ACLTDP_05895 [Terrisporobacter sp.]